MARDHCTDTQYYRVRLTYVLEGFNTLHTYNGPYSAKGTATAQLKRQLRMNRNLSPALSGIEVTEPIVWKDVE